MGLMSGAQGFRRGTSLDSLLFCGSQLGQEACMSLPDQLCFKRAWAWYRGEEAGML